MKYLQGEITALFADRLLATGKSPSQSLYDYISVYKRQNILCGDIPAYSAILVPSDKKEKFSTDIMNRIREYGVMTIQLIVAFNLYQSILYYCPAMYIA